MVKLYLDTASPTEAEAKLVQGFTTNPTLMRKAGVTSYMEWAKDLCARFPHHSISFEVVADDFDEMASQARRISKWGQNVYVKIPVVNTEGTFSGKLIKALGKEGIKVNVTAVMTRKQITQIVAMLSQHTTPAIISVFAGRIADTGIDPSTIVGHAVKVTRQYRHVDVLWASTRQAFDVHFCAGADIITVSPEILNRLHLNGKDLDDYSRKTVVQFFNDAESAGYTL